MGFFLLFPLLTFFGLKLCHYLFLAAVRSSWYLFYYLFAQLWADSSRESSINTASSASGRSVTMPAISAGQTAASPRHSLVQFLNNVLSMRGHTHLPYDEDVKFDIRQHVLAMLKEFQGLQVKTASFTHNDGRSSYLLQAVGTIPMFYKNNKYNIPVTMWLVEAYPRVAPLVFVTPTRDMIIKAHHPWVDADGAVTVPYLQQWVYRRSNLLDLVRSLSLVFGEDPPMYARPSSAQQQRVPASPPPRASSETIHATNPLRSSASPASPANSPVTLRRPPPPYTVYPSSPGSSSRMAPTTKATTPEEAFQINATNTLTERLQQDSKTILRQGAFEMDELFNAQVTLNARRELLEQGFRDVQQEKEALEEQLQLYMTNTHAFETWLSENQDQKWEYLNIDETFEPADEISRQLLESIAADLTIEDTLYSLDRAVQDGSVPWEAYYKAVRQLSREQFYHRALCLKLKAGQLQLDVENMATNALEKTTDFGWPS